MPRRPPGPRARDGRRGGRRLRPSTEDARPSTAPSAGRRARPRGPSPARRRRRRGAARCRRPRPSRSAGGPAPAVRHRRQSRGRGTADDGRFKVRLANFEGPFDLLLQLISKHKLDVTEVALSKVTDEFMAHIRAMGPDWDLDQTTEFLVVAATLLDLKAARLLPAAEVEDEADLALLEARDLLFARLLQYRAYKQIAEIFSARLDEEARRYPRTVGLGAAPRRAAARGRHQHRRRRVRQARGEGDAAQAQAAGVRRPHPRAPRSACRSRPGSSSRGCGRPGRSASGSSSRTHRRHPHRRRPLPRPAGALPGEGRRPGPGDALGELMVRWTGGDGDGQPMVTDEFDRPTGAGRGRQKA